MNRHVRLLSIGCWATAFLFSAVSLVHAGWNVDVCAGGQHNGSPPVIHFATMDEVNQMLNNMGPNDRPCFTVESGGCDDPCNSAGGSASGTDELTHDAVQVLMNPNSTSQQRVFALSAPFLQAFMQNLFSQPDNSAEIAREQEAQRQAALAAELERQRQARLAEEKYQRIKGMLKFISGADNVQMTSISGAGQVQMKPMFGDSPADSGLKPMDMDSGSPAAAPGPGGNSALSQLKRAVYFSQQAAQASTDEDAKFMSAEAFDPTITQMKEADLPPAVNDVQVSGDQARQYNEMLKKREKDQADVDVMKAAVANIEIDKKTFQKVEEELNKQIAAQNQAVSALAPDDKAGQEKAKAELGRLENLKAQSDEALRKEVLKEKEEKAKEKEDRAASVAEEALMRKYVAGVLIAANPKNPSSGWAQVSMQNNSGTWLYLYVDNVSECGPVMPSGFCTTHVRPGFHMLQAFRRDNGQPYGNPQSINVPKGSSPTWTVQ